MTQPQEAVGGNDTVVTAEPTIEDRLSAAFSGQTEEEQEQPADPVPEGDPQIEGEEDLIIPEEDGGTPEEEGEAEVPPIAAPNSWTAEEKEEFAKLPRDLQETLSRREGERDKGLQSKMREASQQASKVEAQALEAIQQMRQTHERELLALLPQIPEKPSYQLQAQNPHLFAQLMDQHDTAVSHYNAIAQRLEAMNQQESAQQAALRQKQALASQQMLQEQFPEYLDPEKGPELRNTLRSTALWLGYSDDQLAQSDAQDVLAMRKIADLKAKADKYDALMAKQMQRVRDGKKLPAITKPGAQQSKGAVEGRRYADDRKAMKQGDKEAEKRVFARFV